MSRSSVERGSPCSELASDPAVTYATPSRSRMAATASATRSGSGRPSGAIGRSPRVGAPDGLGSPKKLPRLLLWTPNDLLLRVLFGRSVASSPHGAAFPPCYGMTCQVTFDP